MKKKKKKKDKKRKEAKRMDQYLDHYRFLSQMFTLTQDEAYQIKANELMDQLKSGDKKINIKSYGVYRTIEEGGTE